MLTKYLLNRQSRLIPTWLHADYKLEQKKKSLLACSIALLEPILILNPTFHRSYSLALISGTNLPGQSRQVIVWIASASQAFFSRLFADEPGEDFRWGVPVRAVHCGCRCRWGHHDQGG